MFKELVLYSRLMDELEQKISRVVIILNDERQYMKTCQDVEVGKFEVESHLRQLRVERLVQLTQMRKSKQ